MRNILFIIIAIFILTGCSQKQPIVSKSATIVFKTPLMKFYDKGFVTKYDEYIHLQIFNVGKVVLDLKIYNDEVCQGTFQCLSAKDFNTKYLSSSYEDDFLMRLFEKEKVKFRDRKNNILIKVRKD